MSTTNMDLIKEEFPKTKKSHKKRQMNAMMQKQLTHNNSREKGPLADQLQIYLPPKWTSQFCKTLPINKVEEIPDVK